MAVLSYNLFCLFRKQLKNLIRYLKLENSSSISKKLHLREFTALNSSGRSCFHRGHNLRVRGRGVATPAHFRGNCICALLVTTFCARFPSFVGLLYSKLLNSPQRCLNTIIRFLTFEIPGCAPIPWDSVLCPAYQWEPLTQVLAPLLVSIKVKSLFLWLELELRED